MTNRFFSFVVLVFCFIATNKSAFPAEHCGDPAQDGVRLFVEPTYKVLQIKRDNEIGILRGTVVVEAEVSMDGSVRKHVDHLEA